MIEWPDVSGLLEGIPHAIAGAVATREYMPERATTDLDVVVLPGDTRQAAERLRGAGYTETGVLTIGGSSWRAPNGTPVDLIEGHEPWWKDALDDAARERNAAGEPILPLPWLVLMKLNASRAQDVADVSRMLGLAGAGALDRVRATLAKHAPELSEDVESLIALGKLETESSE